MKSPGNGISSEIGEGAIPMPKGLVSIYVKCPYYRREERKQQIKIVCEGVLDRTSLHQMFETLPDLKEHKEYFCKGDWKNCPIAEALNRKYAYEI